MNKLKKTLALLLSLVMILSLLPAAAFAEDELPEEVSEVMKEEARADVALGSVAKIGDTGYSTLAAALADAQTGDTITLLANVQEHELNCGGTLTIDLDGHHIDGGNSWVLFYNGELTITGGGYITSSYPGPASTQDPEATIGIVNGRLTLRNGAEIRNTSSQGTAVDGFGCDIVIDGGSINSANKAITGYAGKSVTVSGGTIQCSSFVTASGFFGSGTGYTSVTVTGGTFNINPSAYVDTNNYKVSGSNGTYTVQAKKNYVAEIGSTKYETLEAAVTDANAAEEAVTITLLNDASMDSNVTITGTVILDLAGHAITSAADDLFTVPANGSLTINDTVGGGSIYTDNWTVLTVTGGTVVVNAGKIGASKGNTAFRNAGSITFNGGMVNQADKYYTVGDGLVTYSGYGENEGYYIFAPATVTAVSPAAFELASNGTQQLTATTNGTVTLAWSSSDTSVATVDENGLVTAHGNGSATIYAADAATGSYATATVTVGDKVFKNTRTNTEYASLQVAVNEATSGDTIQLLSDNTIATLVTFPEGKTLTLNLDGNTLTESTNGDSLLKNEGTLTITGDGTITNSADNSLNLARGLVDNYGTLVVENGTYRDYGQGGGASFRNMEGTMTIKSGTSVEAFAAASGNATVSSSATLIVEDGVRLVNHSTDAIASSGYGVYCLSIYGGNATIGTVDAANPTIIDGNRGAIGINGGTLIINSGTFTGTLYRDLWITNDGDNTSVTINGGTFSGAKESILAAIDDGNQDMSDVAVTINDGYFKKNITLGAKDSDNEWTLAIKGGYYVIEPKAAYIAEGYEVVDSTVSGYNYTVREHVHKHSYDYENPTVFWAKINGKMTAVFTYACSCGEVERKIVSENADTTIVASNENPGVNASYNDYETVYDAYDGHENKVTRTETVKFEVYFENISGSVDSYNWGEICRLTSSDNLPADWYIEDGGTEILAAVNKSVYSFPVTENVTIRCTPHNGSQTDYHDRAISAKLESTEAGKATFQTKWSLPDGATVKSVKVYRGYTNGAAAISQDTLRQYGTAMNVNLLVRNGDYKLNLSNLTPGTYQYVMIEITYRTSGLDVEDDLVFTSEVQRVQVQQ